MEESLENVKFLEQKLGKLLLPGKYKKNHGIAEVTRGRFSKKNLWETSEG